jgi:hypothetical protein
MAMAENDCVGWRGASGGGWVMKMIFLFLRALRCYHWEGGTQAALHRVDQHASSRHHNFGGTLVVHRMGGKTQLVSSVFANTVRNVFFLVLLLLLCVCVCVCVCQCVFGFCGGGSSDGDVMYLKVLSRLIAYQSSSSKYILVSIFHTHTHTHTHRIECRMRMPRCE